jgi:hypothetical protein
MSKYIVVQGCSMSVTGVTAGSLNITSSPSSKVKAGNLGVYRGTVQVQLTGCTNGTYSQTAPATGNFTTSATKFKADNELVILEGDKATGISVSMQNTVTPFDSQTFTAVVTIDSAGQTKVKGV